MSAMLTQKLVYKLKMSYTHLSKSSQHNSSRLRMLNLLQCVIVLLAELIGQQATHQAASIRIALVWPVLKRLRRRAVHVSALANILLDCKLVELSTLREVHFGVSVQFEGQHTSLGVISVPVICDSIISARNVSKRDLAIERAHLALLHVLANVIQHCDLVRRKADGRRDVLHKIQDVSVHLRVSTRAGEKLLVCITDWIMKLQNALLPLLIFQSHAILKIFRKQFSFESIQHPRKHIIHELMLQRCAERVLNQTQLAPR